MKYFVIFLALICTGCSVLKHSGELLVLKSVADDDVYLAKKVKAQDLEFQNMLKVYEVDKLAEYKTKRQFIKTFGPPVFERVYDKNNALDEWLYRYSTQFFNSPKIYIYFDVKGEKTDLRYVAGKEIDR